MKIAFHVEPIPGVSEDQSSMIAECYEVPDRGVFLLHQMSGSTPIGLLVDPADLVANHPEYPCADYFYPTAVSLAKGIRAHPEIDTSAWKGAKTAEYF